MCKFTKLYNIFKTLILIIIISGICYQIQHTALLLLNEDSECCPCMQLKMFYINLDRSACCECPNGFHLSFTFIDFLVETIYDISSIFISVLFMSAFAYTFYLIGSFSFRNFSSFLIAIILFGTLTYNYQNQFDGGYVKLIGTNTMYNLCEMKCNMYDSKKKQYTCSARCLNRYMTKDYLEVLNNVHDMNKELSITYKKTVNKAKLGANSFINRVNDNYKDTYDTINSKVTDIFSSGEPYYNYVYDTGTTTTSYIKNKTNNLYDYLKNLF